MARKSSSSFSQRLTACRLAGNVGELCGFGDRFAAVQPFRALICASPSTIRRDVAASAEASQFYEDWGTPDSL